MPGIQVVCLVVDNNSGWEIISDMREVSPPDESWDEEYYRFGARITLDNGSYLTFQAFPAALPTLTHFPGTHAERLCHDPLTLKGFEAHIGWVRDFEVLADGDLIKSKQIRMALLSRLRARGNYPRFLLQSDMRIEWLSSLSEQEPTDG